MNNAIPMSKSVEDRDLVGLIADFSGGTGYPDEKGNYTQKDVDTALYLVEQAARETAKIDGVKDEKEIKASVEFYKNMASEKMELVLNGGIVREGTMPKALLKRAELREKAKFSPQHIKIAEYAAQYFLDAEYTPQGVIFMAEAGIAQLYNKMYSEAEASFRYAKQDMVRDLLFRQCIDSNIALSLLLQGKKDDALEIFDKLQKKHLSLEDGNEKDYARLIVINGNNSQLLPYDASQMPLQLIDISSHMPTIFYEPELEDPTFESVMLMMREGREKTPRDYVLHVPEMPKIRMDSSGPPSGTLLN